VVSTAELDLEDMQPLLALLPGDIGRAVQGMGAEQQWIYLTANYMFAPMFLIVPLMVSSILGADSFVGEKERRTLEGLFYTPASDTELFVAKVLMALLPALGISIGSFIIYGIVVNVAGYPIMGRIFFPSATWWPLVFWMGPAVSVLGIGATVAISSRSKTFMQAQQVSGVLVLPVVFLMIGQVTGLFFLGIELAIGVGAVVWLIGLWLVWVGAKTFSRDRLMTSM
jgi:ABC-type Na+ efflux pump permease subunit